MNLRERAILTGFYADVLAIGGRPFNHGPDSGIENCITSDARSGVVAVNAAKWLGRELTASESVMNSRAYRSLERLGFVERILGFNGKKIVALRLTEAGKIAAGHLLGAKESLCASAAAPYGHDEQLGVGGPAAYLPNRAWSAAPPLAGHEQQLHQGPASVSEAPTDG